MPRFPMEDLPTKEPIWTCRRVPSVGGRRFKMSMPTKYNVKKGTDTRTWKSNRKTQYKTV